MSEITQDRLDRIVETADEILSALAGKNEDVHPDDSKKMCQLWDELNDSLAPPEVVKAIVLELSELRKEREAAVPVAYMYRDRLHSDARFSLESRFGNWSPEDIAEYEVTETKLYTTPPAQPVAVPGHDYKAIVERIAEILHGKVTDIDLLTVTVQAMKERVKERHQMLMEDTVSRQELTRSLCDLLGVAPTYSLEELKEAIEKRGAEPSPVEADDLDAIKRDALRYAWVRGDIESPADERDVYMWDKRGQKYEECGDYISGTELDAYIDSLLEASQPAKGGE
ncbi:hypothetical protein ACI00F_003820 [Cronobacter dublinensis]